MKYKIKFHCKQHWQTRVECSQQILIPHDWHYSVDFGALFFSVFLWQFSMCNWHLLLCPVPVNFLSIFGTGSSTKSAVPRNIFIFNCTIVSGLFYLCCRFTLSPGSSDCCSSSKHSSLGLESIYSSSPHISPRLSSVSLCQPIIHIIQNMIEW